MSDQLQAGVARIDITPPLGLTMAGYGGRTETANGIEDPLYAYAVVLEQGEEACGFVVGDLIGLPRRLTQMLRERVTELCGLPGEKVFTCGTHTHWGPALNKTNYLSGTLNDCVSEEYAVTCIRQMAGAIAEAWRTRRPAIALAGTGEADQVKFNRRPVNAEGKNEMNLRLPLDEALVASRVGAELAETWKKDGPPGERLSDLRDDVQGLRMGPANTELPLLKLITPEGEPIAALF